MGSTAQGLLLARYLAAAQAVTQPSYHRQGNTPGRLPARKDNEGGDDNVVQSKDRASQEEPEVLDPAVVAVTELLSRQARIVIQLHKALAADPSSTHGVDELLLKKRIADLVSISNSKFYAYRYDCLPASWRQIYTDTLILETHHLLLRPLLAAQELPEGTLNDIIQKLDRALITAGGGGRQQWLEKTLQMLEDIWTGAEELSDKRPSKRQRKGSVLQSNFSTAEPFGRPSLSPKWACPRYSGWTLEQFEDYMNSPGGAPWPIVLTDLIGDWPALTDCPWRSPEYLLSKTFGGRRLVPVEVGRSYVDDGWGQELIQFREFLSRYINDSKPAASSTNPSTANTPSSLPPRTGYLAQHNLFQQIPSLRNDIRVPDFCWADVPGHPVSAAHDRPAVGVPQLNAWFGPSRTITPLHTDGYHNLLCQAVGAKYLRLYPPTAGSLMRPRSPERGVDMSNTSALDIGVIEGWDPRPDGVSEDHVRHIREELEGLEYRECILAPGDTLLIPIGWWHYVRSLSVSFSVSFWWN